MAYDAHPPALEVHTSDFGTVVTVDTAQPEGRAAMRQALAALSAPRNRPEAFDRALSIVRSQARLKLLDDTAAWVRLRREHAEQDRTFTQSPEDRAAAQALAELSWPNLYLEAGG